MQKYPYVITVSSEKGGVGKTTLATNLAIYLKALREDLPISIFSFDNHFTVDKMFEMKGQALKGDVEDLLHERPASEVLHTGQYGVSYIPSSGTLSDTIHTVNGPMALARMLAVSDIPGIIIIDTRPTLDILTQNALYAADRVLIPVKDMPSLENCKNIFSLFDKRGLNKKSLALLPCLVDERIKFDGLFKDQKTLLKGYAVNRGFKCLDCYISKSPKVESLNTNPDGKIYPILTHARWTEVHGQFAQLARLLVEEYTATTEPRSLLFHQWMSEEEEKKKESYLGRLSGLRSDCSLCGQPAQGSGNGATAYYFEDCEGGNRGFFDERCFIDFLLSSVYNIDRALPEDDPTWQMFRETALESVFAFRPVDNGSGASVEFHRFGLDGEHLAAKKYALHSATDDRSNGRDGFNKFLATTLNGQNSSTDRLVVVHPTPNGNPAAILAEEKYRTFSRLKKTLLSQLA